MKGVYAVSSIVSTLNFLMYQKIGKKVLWEITCNMKKSRILTYLNINELDRLKIRKLVKNIYYPDC